MRQPRVERSSAALLAALAAAAVASALTPPSGGTGESGLAGLPRLALYALSGSVLAVVAAAPRCLLASRTRARTPLRAFVALAVGTVGSALLALLGAARLANDMADPAAVALWIASMLVLLMIGALPLVRRIGWADVWPTTKLTQKWLWLAIAVIVAATVMRVFWLDQIPRGINADEGDRASSAFDVLSGTAPQSWFASGWFYINMVYFRLLALTFGVFGPDVGGGRMLNAVVGSAFVAVVAWLGCRNFGWRIGLVAAALAAGVGMSLQHSRLISETGPTALLWAIALGGFLEGARRGSIWGFALAGVCGGLSLYFYPSARLWAVGAILTVLAFGVAFARDRHRWQALAAGVSVAAVGALVSSAPFLMHLRQVPLETANRYAQTAVLDPANQVRLPYLNAPEPLPRLLALQVERTLGMFDRHPDGGGLLPTGRPIFPKPIAALALVSVVYGTVRGLHDLRLALMAIWFWVGLSGVLLTVETPNVLRAVGIMAPLFVLMAVLLVNVVDCLLAAADKLRPSGARLLYAGLAPALLAVAIAGSEASTYFGTFRELQDPWGPATREGQLIASVGANGPTYSLEMNEHMVTSGWVRLLAPGVERGRLPNPGRDLLQLAPAPEVGRQGVSFVFSRDANQEPYFDLVQRLYPGGAFVDGGDGRHVYSVSPAALAAARGPLVQSGTDPLRWSGGVQLRGGTHGLRVRGPGLLRVSISGIEVATGERDVNFEIAAAHGVHFVEVTSGMAGTVELEVDGRAVTDSYRLMDAPWGLLGRLDSAPTSEGVLDATVAMAFFDPALGTLAVPTSITWSGWLHVPRSGTYRMAFAAEDPMRLEVDGARVDVVRVGPSEWARLGVGSLVELSEGPHSVRAILDVTHGGRNLARWNWVPPSASGAADLGAAWSVVPPMVLRPEPPVRKL